MKLYLYLYRHTSSLVDQLAPCDYSNHIPGLQGSLLLEMVVIELQNQVQISVHSPVHSPDHESRVQILHLDYVLTRQIMATPSSSFELLKLLNKVDNFSDSDQVEKLLRPSFPMEALKSLQW